MHDVPHEANHSTASSSSETEHLREELSEVYHDLNNSLAVISGNAQLLSELARAENLGAAFTDPLKDVEAARAEISEVLDRLNHLRATSEPPQHDKQHDEQRS